MPGDEAGHLFAQDLVVGFVAARHVVTVVPHVSHGAAVAFAEPLTELISSFASHGRMLIHPMVIGIGVTMFGIVSARGFNAFVVPLALGIPVLVGWLIPAITILILILGNGAHWLRCMSRSFQRAR